MRNLNNRGFTLVEVIAAVVILAVLAMLLVPNVTSLLNRSEDDAFENLKKSILVAAEEYINDNRYDISLANEADGKRKVISIGDQSLVDSKITLSVLLKYGYLSASGIDGTVEYIVDPRDRTTKLDLDSRYVFVTFDVKNKKYVFKLDSYFDE